MGETTDVVEANFHSLVGHFYWLPKLQTTKAYLNKILLRRKIVRIKYTYVYAITILNDLILFSKKYSNLHVAYIDILVNKHFTINDRVVGN